jgi:NAD(P)-dependent dehydrogenase (short-subunit alcohol dehydrogenase family)
MMNTQFESVNTTFESERIVILGGTSGIGLATAERAAADGATVIVASSNADRIDAALERLPSSAEGYTVDVRREEQLRDLFRRLSAARWTRSRAPWRSNSHRFGSTPWRPAWCAAICGGR